MKLSYSPESGVLKVRPSLGTILTVGVALAGVKMVYEATYSAYIVALRRSLPKLEALAEDARAQVEAQKKE